MGQLGMMVMLSMLSGDEEGAKALSGIPDHR